MINGFCITSLTCRFVLSLPPPAQLCSTDVNLNLSADQNWALLFQPNGSKKEKGGGGAGQGLQTAQRSREGSPLVH